MQTLERLPVAENLFQGEGRDTRLIGTLCRSCGTHYFPKSLSCRNPQCREKVIEDTLLGPSGILYSYTVQIYRPPALFRMDPWEPYAIGMVELGQGLRVMGMLTGCALDAIQIGMALELTVETLYRDEQGRDVATYKFRPVAAQGATP
jgi:uncharacterized OB-fold protein